MLPHVESKQSSLYSIPDKIVTSETFLVHMWSETIETRSSCSAHAQASSAYCHCIALEVVQVKEKLCHAEESVAYLRVIFVYKLKNEIKPCSKCIAPRSPRTNARITCRLARVFLHAPANSGRVFDISTCLSYLNNNNHNRLRCAHFDNACTHAGRLLAKLHDWIA